MTYPGSLNRALDGLGRNILPGIKEWKVTKVI